MTTLVLFVLCSGLVQFTFASNRLRRFNLRNNESFWTDLQDECKEDGSVVVTLYDEEDANFTRTFTRKENPEIPDVWLGLKKAPKNVTTWSNGDLFELDKLNVTLNNGEQICEAMVNGTRTGFKCSERKHFMCHKGNEYILIDDEEKNWCQAEQHCLRRHANAHLVSIHNETQKEEVIEKGTNKTFWIGLLHDQWEWMDSSCSTYRDWGGSEHNSEKNCTIQLFTDQHAFRPYRCDNTNHVLCSKGNVRIIVIKERLTWEDALNYCKAKHTDLLWIEDEKDQDAVEQWLKHTDDEEDGPFWISLRQSSIFGFWIWSDRIVDYSNWKNYAPPEMPMSHNCGVIDKKEGYKWRDENCLLELPFLCEEEILFL